jgi:hypothetical protein
MLAPQAAVAVDQLEMTDHLIIRQRHQDPSGAEVGVKPGRRVLGQLEQRPQVRTGTGIQLDPHTAGEHLSRRTGQV